ncbi:caspase family protein [Bradyrhizobium prioriisuperbiae]|uniref:caspase family protein n=1 Tax=Bradyrhizobium prioriisuperbiae TaxID=2854389 RepID=UPI0028E3EA66|nr:caspase family protein [Bradyrhizobium prioritasuperba]
MGNSGFWKPVGPILTGMFAALLWVAVAIACTSEARAAAKGRPDRATAQECDRTDDYQARVTGCTRLIETAGLPPVVRSAAYWQRAQGYNRTGRPELAVPDLDEAIRLNPTFVLAYVERALSNSFLSKDDDIIRDATRASELNPKLTIAYVVLGHAYARKKELDKALAALDVALRVDPKLTAALAARADLWIKKKELRFALADADQIVKLQPKDGLSYALRCHVLEGMASFDEAIADCTQAIALGNPALVNAASGYQNRATVYFKMGNLDRALTDYDQSIRLDPKNAGALSERSDVWRAKGDLERAQQDADDALRFNPDLAKLHTSRGLILEARGNAAGAREDYKAALALADYSSTKGYSQTFVDDSSREKEIARARLTALSVDAGPSLGPAAQMSEKRIALVIGNSAYRRVTALPNPASDARLVAKNLTDLGFQVSEGIDLDKAELKRTILQFVQRTASASLVVLFYAGHGMQIDGRNFLLPVDVDPLKARELSTEVLDLNFILAGLDDRLRTNIIILDACRDNPFAQKDKDAQAAEAGRSIVLQSGLAQPSGLGSGATLGAGTLLVFATAPGQVALDGNGANSPFSLALVRHIKTPRVDVQQMLTRVRADVVASTNGKQVPWSNSSLLGEVFLGR